ncbi:hypothetical protein [Streptomyces virginiae]|uniref:Uncharacterized protein n=1 Tax=Streptomyces virginiae TaxID=1961 RepID=A0ABZ1TNV3_STRVG|nr:hypothetical protein [Streptomyces virginiae]
MQRGDGSWFAVEPILGTTGEGADPDAAVCAVGFALGQHFDAQPHERSVYAQAAAALGDYPVVDLYESPLSRAEGQP